MVHSRMAKAFGAVIAAMALVLAFSGVAFGDSGARSLYTTDSQTKSVQTAKANGWKGSGTNWSYYKNGKQVKGSWVVTATAPMKNSASGLQRYWIGKNGKLAINRLVNPNEGSKWWAYATSKGYVVRGKHVVKNCVYLANNDGKLESGDSKGMLITNKYDKAAKRYFIDKKAHAAITGKVIKISGYGSVFGIPKKGYVATSKYVNGNDVLLANKTGRIYTKTGWLVTKTYDGVYQRYYMDSKGHYAVPRLGLFTVDGKRYYGMQDVGYELRNKSKYINGTWYKANNDGVLTSDKNRSKHIESYVAWAVAIANDNSHGYTQDLKKRWGPDYDCSSLVISALKNNGFEVGAAVYTGNMKSELTKHGFKWFKANKTNMSKLKRGDILLNVKCHTAIYLGNSKLVNATISENGTVYGKTGDQTGREIRVGNYYNYPWNGYLRYVGD